MPPAVDSARSGNGDADLSAILRRTEISMDSLSSSSPEKGAAKKRVLEQATESEPWAAPPGKILASTANGSTSSKDAGGASLLQRELWHESHERDGKLGFKVVNNDSIDASFVALVDSKTIFGKQLPKMPKECGLPYAH